MNTKQLYLDPACLGSSFNLVDVVPDMYVEGVRQAEPVGFRCEVLLPAHKYDRLSVRIAGPQQIEAPVSGTSPVVTFTDLKVRPYVNRNTGTMAFSAAATGIKLADKASSVNGNNKA